MKMEEVKSKIILKLGMSRKEYHSRISKFVDTSMVKKKGTRYSISVFGRVIYKARLILAKTLANRKQRARENQLTPEDPHNMQGYSKIKINQSAPSHEDNWFLLLNY